MDEHEKEAPNQCSGTNPDLPAGRGSRAGPGDAPGVGKATASSDAGGGKAATRGDAGDDRGAGHAAGTNTDAPNGQAAGRAALPATATGPRRQPGGGSEPDARSDSAVVQLKQGITAVRNVRDGLVQVLHWLAEQPGLRGYLLLADPRLGQSLLAKEFLGLHAAMRPEVAERLYLVVARGGQLERGGPLGPGQAPIPDDDRPLLNRCLAAAADPKTVLPNPCKREEVLWVLIERWVRGAGPVKAVRLQRIVGCNYRTAVAMTEKIRPALVEHSDRQIELARFPEAAWRESLALQGKARATMRFALASSPPRSHVPWIEALKALGRSDIAIGGALGAQRHHPGLQCPAAARLDLCVHAPHRTVDLDFLRQLEPALKPVDDPRETAHLAVRFVRRRESPVAVGEDALAWADPVECLLGLHDARLEAEAAALEMHLRERGRASLPDPPFWDRPFGDWPFGEREPLAGQRGSGPTVSGSHGMHEERKD